MSYSACFSPYQRFEVLDVDDDRPFRRRRLGRAVAAELRDLAGTSGRRVVRASGGAGASRLHVFVLHQNVADRSFRRRRSRMRIAVRFSATTTRQQQQRRHVHHGLRRLHVGRLEADVVDVEAQVHELALEVEEREIAVERQLRRELDDARDHQRRHLAGAPRHRQDQARQDPGQRRREDDAADRLPLGRPERVGALPRAARHGRQRLLGGHDDDRHGQERQRQRGPEDAARLERRIGQARREEELVDGAARQVHEEPQAEDPEDDRGHAGEVVHGDPHGAHERPLPGVLPQVQRGDDAERHDGRAHQDHHHDRPEDRRKDAALRVGLARLARRRTPRAGRSRRRASRRSRGCWAGRSRTTAETGNRLLRPVGVGEDDLCPSRSPR